MSTRATTPRLRNAAVLAPLLGLLLLLPPLIAPFTAPVRVFGIPLVVLYLFGLWAALIAGAWWLARRLGTPAHPGQSDGDDEGLAQPDPPAA